MAKPHILTEKDIAALAAGAPVASSALVLSAPTEAEVAAAAAAAADVLAAQATAFAAARVEAETLEAARVAALATKPVEKTEGELVTFLRAQVVEKDAALLAAALSAQADKAKLAGIEATHAALTDLVRASVGKMQVALGGSATDMSAMTDVQVLAEHARVSASFLAKFKVGGVAISAAKTEPESESVVADPLQAAKLAAVQPTK